MNNRESPSRRVSRESLGDWANRDVLAHHALYAGRTEAELICALLEDRQRLKEVICKEAFKRLQARKDKPLHPSD